MNQHSSVTAPADDASPRTRYAPDAAQRHMLPQLETYQSRRSHGSLGLRMLGWGLGALLVLGAVVLMTGVIQFGPSESLLGGDTATTRDIGGTWSYFHDRKYETHGTGARWSSDRSRSSDPAESVLGDTSRWEYDGPYRYGPYGSDGMRRRGTGSETRDPLYSQPAPTQDVFTQYGGDLDPS
ncbi:MAG: hypothetical protein ABI200_04475, partial [Gaiellales bacterium]